MNTKELKAGAIFSYLLIIANTLYALIFTPFFVFVGYKSINRNS